MKKIKYRKGDHFILHAYDDSTDYDVYVMNVYENGDPEEKYEIEINNINGEDKSYYELCGEYYTCGDWLMSQLEYVGNIL